MYCKSLCWKGLWVYKVQLPHSYFARGVKTFFAWLLCIPYLSKDMERNHDKVNAFPQRAKLPGDQTSFGNRDQWTEKIKWSMFLLDQPSQMSMVSASLRGDNEVISILSFLQSVWGMGSLWMTQCQHHMACISVGFLWGHGCPKPGPVGTPERTWVCVSQLSPQEETKMWVPVLWGEGQGVPEMDRRQGERRESM